MKTSKRTAKKATKDTADVAVMSFRIPRPLADRLQEAARRDRRTMNSQVIVILESALSQ